jgi:hypothetical protein
LRPDGWEAELDRLLQEAAAAEMAAKDERHERGAQRRLAGAEAALARAESTARAKTSEALTLQQSLQAAREAGQALAAEVERLRAHLDHIAAERGELIRRLKGAAATANERTSELRATRHELRMAQAELAGGDGVAPSPPAPEVAPAPPEPVAPPPPPGPDLERLRELAALGLDKVAISGGTRGASAEDAAVGRELVARHVLPAMAV